MITEFARKIEIKMEDALLSFPGPLHCGWICSSSLHRSDNDCVFALVAAAAVWVNKCSDCSWVYVGSEIPSNHFKVKSSKDTIDLDFWNNAAPCWKS